MEATLQIRKQTGEENDENNYSGEYKRNPYEKQQILLGWPHCKTEVKMQKDKWKTIITMTSTEELRN